MPKSNDSAAPPSNGQNTSPILEECKRLQAVQSFLSELWHDEVHLYEHSSAVNDFCNVDHHHETRNRPNSLGTVENVRLFPYHTALYPLLDCYDSIRDDEYFSQSPSTFVVRPSPAPMPFDFDGHRRSKFSPRLDRHLLQIEELNTLEGHLPNSAWAVKQLMPGDRRAQFIEFETRMGDNSESVNNQPTNQGADEIHDEASRHNDTRFWNILMNPVSETNPVLLSDMSVSPEEEFQDFHSESDDDNSEWEDVDDGGEGNGEWEDVDDEANEIPVTTKAKDARDFTFLRWWQHAIVKERKGLIHDAETAEMASSLAACEYYSPENLFKNNPSATLTLFKVLKHALSDLQREFRLARAVLLLITDWRLCDDTTSTSPNEGGGIECLRRLLTIVSSEYVHNCGGYCHEWYIENGGITDNDDDYEDVLESSARLDAPNHYCSDWWEFLGSLTTLLSYGITYMTEKHANVICGFVLQEINRTSSSAGPIDDGGPDSNSESLSSKAYLKQSIYFLNNAECDGRPGLPQDSTGWQLNINLLLAILSGLRQHAVSDRMRLVKLLDLLNCSNSTCDREKNGIDVPMQISKTLQSFQACIEILVDIGERCLLRLPTNSSGRQLGGMVVRGILEGYVGNDKFASVKPLSYLAEEMVTSCRSVIDPLRYADAVTNSSNNPLLDPSRSRDRNIIGKHTIEKLIGYQPPKDVQDIVKALYMRDLVDLQVSGCGYGDFLSWCHLPMSPEPLLFDYKSNIPYLAMDNGEPRNDRWALDEDGTMLDNAHLSSRYDFSILVFLRQWQSPWTPESHLSFSIPYRRAISTLALCAHRYGVPHDISILVNSFLPRSWWTDDRRCCWCRECQLNQVKHIFQRKITTRLNNWGTHEEISSTPHLEAEKGTKSPTLTTCPGCQIAMACSKDHLKYIHQDGHKRYCGLPPFRAPFSDEDNVLCRQILGTEEEDVGPLDNDEDQNDDGQADEIDDDGSWESVDSNEEVEAAGKSDLIHSFFDEKSYKLQRRTAPPFANFF
ncbi:hypothetical protein ACHAXR_005675 [Thalassiosira sp. AJA248-18]